MFFYKNILNSVELNLFEFFLCTFVCVQVLRLTINYYTIILKIPQILVIIQPISNSIHNLYNIMHCTLSAELYIVGKYILDHFRTTPLFAFKNLSDILFTVVLRS